MSTEAPEPSAAAKRGAFSWRRPGASAKMALVFAGALLFGLMASFGFERTLGEGKVIRGVRGLGRSLSGLDAKGLTRVLAGENARLARTAFTLKWEQSVTRKSGAELRLAFDVPHEVARALDLGKKGPVPAQFGFWLARLFTPQSFAPRLVVDPRKLREALEPWVQQVVPEPKAPSLSFERELVVDEGRAGPIVDYPLLAQRLSAAFWSLDPRPIEVPTSAVTRLVSEATIQKVRTEAEHLVSAPLTFVAEVPASAPAQDANETLNAGVAPSVRLELSPRDLGPALSANVNDQTNEFELVLSPEVLRKKLAPLLSQVEHRPKDASFERGPGATVQVVPGANGIAVDEPELLRRILEATKTSERTVQVPLTSIEPELTTAQANALGIKGLVASFTTRHKCCQPRVENIHTAAARLDGVVLRPGERFSLNDRLGPRLARAGYRQAPTIVKGDMKEVLGGGISQLATTLFNVALRGGYAIVQRQPHSIYFPRYPEGHEATVSYPQPDLIFDNDTRAGLLIRTHYTDTFIKVEIYGDNGGRRVQVSKSKRYDIVEPPTEYEVDDRLEPDERKTLVAGQLGWTVLVSREITFADGTKKTEKREVKYNPRAQLIRVHSCNVPEGFEGYTGQKCPDPPRDEREEELSEDGYYETTNFEYDDEGG